jgi:4-amino-4-deoxy-L-arabinose transferase-like glycosyltransferase
LKPFLVTNLQAGKLPRWLLGLLCILYCLPGLIGRDPWRADDAANFGVGLTMARGQLSDWLLPNLAGLAMPDRGPMAGWLFAIAALIGQGLNSLGMTFITEHLAVRVVTMLILFIGFALFWYAAYELASRRGVQPNDPFGVAANTKELGRTLADSALLILMASFGLIARMHETSVDAVQFLWTMLFISGMAYCIERPKRAGWMIGISLAASLLTRGPALAISMIGTWALLAGLSSPFRWTLNTVVMRAATAFVTICAGWLLLTFLINSEGLSLWLSTTESGWPRLSVLSYYGRTFAWFYWPAWPVAIWAVWRWRTRLDEPVIALPLAMILGLAIHALFQTQSNESHLLPLIPAFALLAAMGLPTLKRAVGSLIDWFAVLSFTIAGIAIWTYWFAFNFGAPAKMAFSVQRLAPGVDPNFAPIEVLFGCMATLGWLALIRWRLGRHASSLWRPVALSCGGLILGWFLLMTLWLPFFNDRNTYRDVAQSLSASVNLQKQCVNLSEQEKNAIGTTERASFFYFSRMQFAKPGQKNPCKFLLLKDEGPAARINNNDEPGWRLVWQGGRKNMRDERFRLYQRRG